MIKLSGSVDIERPVAQVFNFLSNFELASQWMTSVIESEVLTDGPIGVASRFREVFKMMGRRIDITCEITEFIPNKKVAWKSVSSSFMSYSGGFMLESLGDKTRLSYEGTTSLQGLWRLIEPLMAMEARKETEAEMQAIKNAVEK